MLSIVDRHVIARESNVVRVDFRGDPVPPAPYFPGANGLRLSHSGHDEGETPMAAIAILGAESRFRTRGSARRFARGSWSACK